MSINNVMPPTKPTPTNNDDEDDDDDFEIVIAPTKV